MAAGPQYPTAIISDVAQTSGRTLAVGTLYGVLDRMVGQGLVVASAPQGRRRPWELTGAGRAALAGYLASMKVVVAVGRSRLAQA